MLVEFGADVDVPFDEGSRILLRSPEEWLLGIAAGAQQREGELLTTVGFEVAHVRVQKKVRIEILNLVESRSKVVLLIRWEAYRAAGLLPVFEGSLELTPIESARSHVFASGEYQPPGGEVGRIADHAMLHRVAVATVQDFVERISEMLLASTQHGPHAGS
jgi:hypothetical protein